MSVIKISNKKLIDELQARLILQLGRKITQQETIDLCIEYAIRNFDDILLIASSTPQLTPKKAKKIIKEFEKYKGTTYDEDAKFVSPNDEDIYSL
ncbi:MAG: hypothetical protein ACTSVY_10925 [Candidatus Helarchaeota archaeon]